MADVEVRAILLEPTGLSGLIPTPGGVALRDGDLVLPAKQPDPLHSDFHYVRIGPWEKALDVPLSRGMTVRVIEGDADETAWSSWVLMVKAPVRGQTALVWGQETKVPRSDPGNGMEDVGGVFGLRHAPDLKGTYPNPIITLDDRRQIEDIESQPVGENTLVGLRVSRTGARQITVDPGLAWVPGTGLVQARSPIVKNLVGLTPSVWHYAYFQDNGGAGDLEISTVPPDAPYLGGARVKGPVPNASPPIPADNTRRLIDEFWVNADGTIARTGFIAGGKRWVEDQNSTLRASGSGLLALTGTNLDISRWCPPYADAVEVALLYINPNNTSTFYVTAAEDGLMTRDGAETSGQLAVVVVGSNAPRQTGGGPIALAAGPLLRHRQTAGGVDRIAHVDVLGYHRRLS